MSMLKYSDGSYTVSGTSKPQGQKGDFMNIEPTVKLCADLMTAASKKYVDKLQLCYFQGNFMCVPCKASNRHYYAIHVFRPEDFEKGFDAKEWNQIRRGISTLMEAIEQ